MQPIISNTTAQYQWERVTPQDLSLKNSHTFVLNGQEVMFATDMENGGVILLDKDLDGQFHFLTRWFEGYKMMWSPYPFWYQDQLYVYVCDTGGGDTTSWWEHMQPYCFSVNDNLGVGPLIRIELPNPDNIGFIDPTVLQIGPWWYLFVVDLWNASDASWWSPRCFVAESPFGPFSPDRQYQLAVPERGIDEAFKAFCGTDRALLCTWSSGDSGIDGDLYMGKLDVTGRHSEGWHFFNVTGETCLQAVDSALCTAGDPGSWPGLYATLRAPGGAPGGRDKFYIGRLRHG